MKQPQPYIPQNKLDPKVWEHKLRDHLDREATHTLRHNITHGFKTTETENQSFQNIVQGVLKHCLNSCLSIAEYSVNKRTICLNMLFYTLYVLKHMVHVNQHLRIRTIRTQQKQKQS